MKKPKYIPEFDDIPSPRAKMPELALEERSLNFEEVELGLSEDLVASEASRCLSCRRCIGCGLCLAECDRDAIVYDQEPEVSSVKVDAVVLAAGSSTFDASLKEELGYRSSMNVVTSVELERMLSHTGPYGGLPLRPGDGSLPARIAFVQCVGSREEGIGADYCSSDCCTDALELASALSEKLDAPEITIFHRGMRPLGRRAEKLFVAAERGDGPRLVMAAVGSVEGADCTGPVTVTYDTGEGDTESEFDLVVLSVGQRPSGAARSVARRLRSDTNKFGFVSTGLLSPSATSSEGVHAAGRCVTPMLHSTAASAGAAAAFEALRGLGGIGTLGAETGAGGTTSAGDGRASAERERDVAAGGGDAADPAGATTGGPAVICVCEEGLAKTDLRPGLVVREVGNLDGITLSISLGMACGRESLERLRGLAGGLADPRFLVAGCYPGTHTELLRQRFAAALGTARVGLVGVEASDREPSDVARRVQSRLASDGGPGARGGGGANLEQRVLVIGGGLAGISAALEAAGQGLQVTLVEPSESLLGTAPSLVSGDPDLHEEWKQLAERAMSDPLVDVRLGSTVSAMEQTDGGLVPRLDGGEPCRPHGAVIVATGARDHRPPGLKEDTVITQDALTARVRKGEVPHGSVVMVQCVGSRSSERPYCSRTCCAGALRNALELRRADSDVEITILHRGVRVWGFDEELLSEAIELGVEFLEVTDTAKVVADGGLKVTATEASGGSEIALEPDLVVLSPGIEPSDAGAGVADILSAACADDGFFTTDVSGKVSTDLDKAHVFACGRATGPADLGERVTRARAVAGRACLLLKRGVR